VAGVARVIVSFRSAIIVWNRADRWEEGCGILTTKEAVPIRFLFLVHEDYALATATTRRWRGGKAGDDVSGHSGRPRGGHGSNPRRPLVLRKGRRESIG